MMTDLLTWSPINLGRWAGTQVRLHITLIMFVGFALLSEVLGGHRLRPTAAWIVLLLAALAIHELGHALVAWWTGSDPEEVRLWPLGNMVGPSASSRSTESWIVPLGGLAASLAMVVITALALNAMGAQFVWDPFGSKPENPAKPVYDLGAPFVYRTNHLALELTAVWWIGWFGYLNWVILLANLLPALPFDMGRALRSYLANASLTSAKDSLLAPWLARGFALILLVVSLFRMLVSRRYDGLYVLMIAALIELMFRAEARMYEEGGYFDDGVFGYDFSEGYTSLEGSAAKVRPYRESALKRWRRRRSDLRRQRRQEREAAEERRMDEILAKLYRDGRAALTDEEHRFLVRVSVKYRNKPRAHD